MVGPSKIRIQQNSLIIILYSLLILVKVMVGTSTDAIISSPLKIKKIELRRFLGICLASAAKQRHAYSQRKYYTGETMQWLSQLRNFINGLDWRV